MTKITVQKVGKVETVQRIPKWAYNTFIALACASGVLFLLVIILLVIDPRFTYNNNKVIIIIIIINYYLY